MLDIHSTLFRIGGEQFAVALSRKLWDALEEVIGPQASPHSDTSAPLPAVIPAAIDSNTKQRRKEGEPLSADEQPRKKAHTVKRRLSIPAASEDALGAGGFGWQEELIEIYSYEPDESSGAADPYQDDSAGHLWSMFYFFFNRRLKRIVFFTLHGVG